MFPCSAFSSADGFATHHVFCLAAAVSGDAGGWRWIIAYACSWYKSEHKPHSHRSSREVGKRLQKEEEEEANLRYLCRLLCVGQPNGAYCRETQISDKFF
jgi:hypothetical protein